MHRSSQPVSQYGYEPVIARDQSSVSDDFGGEEAQDSNNGPLAATIESSPIWKTTSPLCKALLIACFGLLGAATLLPFNSIITPSEFFRQTLQHSRFSASFASWIIVVYNVASALCIVHATVTLDSTTPARRLVRSLIAAVTTLITLLIITLLQKPQAATLQMRSENLEERFLFGADAFFFLIIGITILLAMESAYIQNATVALCSLFGAKAMSAMLASQALIALALSLSQLAASYTQLSLRKGRNLVRLGHQGSGSLRSFSRDLTTPSDAGLSLSPGGSQDAEAGRRAAVNFFTVSVLFMLTVLFSFLKLRSSRIFKDVIGSQQAGSNDNVNNANGTRYVLSDHPVWVQRVIRRLDPQTTTSLANLLNVQRNLTVFALVVFHVSFVTLAVFPTFTSRVHSEKWGKNSTSLWVNPLVFSSLHFVVFNASDLLGRLLASSMAANGFAISCRAAIIATIARSVFLVLFTFCNMEVPRSRSSPAPLLWLATDFGFFLSIAIFAFSNGFLLALAFIVGPGQASSQPEVKARAAGLLTFWLLLGLVAGSFASFAFG